MVVCRGGGGGNSGSHVHRSGQKQQVQRFMCHFNCWSNFWFEKSIQFMLIFARERHGSRLWSWGWTGFVRKVMVQTHFFRSSSPTLDPQPLDRFRRMLNEKMRRQEMEDTGAYVPVSGTHYLWKLCSLGSPSPNDYSGCEFSPIHWAWSLPVCLYNWKTWKSWPSPFKFGAKRCHHHTNA